MILLLIGSGLPVSMFEIWSDLASDRSLRPSLRDKKLYPFRRSFSLNDVSSCFPGPCFVPIIGPEVSYWIRKWCLRKVSEDPDWSYERRRSWARHRQLLFHLRPALDRLKHEILSDGLFLPSRTTFGDSTVFFLFRFPFCSMIWPLGSRIRCRLRWLKFPLSHYAGHRPR